MHSKIHLAAAGIALAGLSASTLAFTGPAAVDTSSVDAPRTRDVLTGPSQSVPSQAPDTAVDGWTAQLLDDHDPDPWVRVHVDGLGQDVDTGRVSPHDLGEDVRLPAVQPLGGLERVDWSSCEGSIFDASVNSTRRCGESLADQATEQVTEQATEQVEQAQQAVDGAADAARDEVAGRRQQVQQEVDAAQQQADATRDRAEREVDEAIAQAEAEVAEIREEAEERQASGEQTRECLASTPIGDLSINVVRGCAS